MALLRVETSSASPCSHTLLNLLPCTMRLISIVSHNTLITIGMVGGTFFTETYTTPRTTNTKQTTPITVGYTTW
jgi:predicted lipase